MVIVEPLVKNISLPDLVTCNLILVEPASCREIISQVIISTTFEAGVTILLAIHSGKVKVDNILKPVKSPLNEPKISKTKLFPFKVHLVEATVSPLRLPGFPSPTINLFLPLESTRFSVFATSRSSSGSQNGSYRQEVVSQPKIVEVKSIVCYNCGEIIPADSKYCPYCSTSLYVTCPKCRHEYSSQYPACSQCGTNRNDYIEKQKELAEAERERKQRLEIIVSRIKEKQQQKEQTPEGREELRREKEVLDSYREKWSKERIEREKRMREAAEKAEKNRQERERIIEEEIQKRRQEREERVRKREKEAAEVQRETGCLYMLILAPFAVILLMCLGLLFS